MDITDKEERKLKKNKISLMRNPKFALWSGIMMVGKTTVDDDFPTACTDGRDEIYGRGLIKMLPDKELCFVILHENLHKAFRHLTTWVKLWEEDKRLTNEACDYVINLMLVDMDPNEQWIAFPKKPDGTLMGLLDTRFKGMHTKQVFDILKKEKEEGGGGEDGEPGGGDGDGDGDGGGFDEHDWKGAKELTAEEKKELEKEIDRGLRQGKVAADKAGNNAGNMNRELEDLLHPAVDWKEVLREFVSAMCAGKDTSSWRRVNRRFISQGIYLPSLVSERVAHIVVGADTSGSIQGLILTRFLTEVKSVCDIAHPEKLDLIYWDAAVAGHEVYGADGASLDSLITSTKPVGGGGTDPRCMMRYLKAENINPDCIIMLTDGEIPDWGNDWTAPILWVVVNKRDIQSPVGKTVMLNE
jgi:predicted metal-dependent peptidase